MAMQEMLHQQNSFFHNQFPSNPDLLTAKVDHAVGKAQSQLRYEDWEHRLQDAANEAGDNNLLALESDLLDLRDEIRNLLD